MFKKSESGELVPVDPKFGEDIHTLKKLVAKGIVVSREESTKNLQAT